MASTELPPVTAIIGGRLAVAGEQHVEQVVTPSRYSYYDAGTNTVTLISSREVSVPSVEREFRVLAEQWYVDTMPLSSYIEKILHPAYQKILALGKDVVPFIMDEIRDMPNDWFWALRILTDADPANSQEAGNIQAMANAWLQWWEEEGPAWRQQYSQ